MNLYFILWPAIELKPYLKVCKKAIRLIANSSYIAHTTLLFKKHYLKGRSR